MQVILEATSGPSVGTKIVVRRGQTARVGRTKWADYSLPADESMADVHFEVQYDRQGCRIRDLSGDAGTLVNDAKVSEAALHTSDQITAGQTTFSVIVEGESPPASEPGDAPVDEAATPAVEEKEAAPQTAADYCGQFELSEEAQPLLREDMKPAEFLEVLAEHELFADAVRLLAHWLPKQAAVRWGCQCVRHVFGDELAPREKDALETAQQWATEPSEENRRAAEAAAEATGLNAPAGWVAMGAFWSGGSLAPPGLADVPPAEGLTAQAMTGALMMAAPHGDPSKTAERYREFLEQGKKLATD